jgi:hypothetical protein
MSRIQNDAHPTDIASSHVAFVPDLREVVEMTKDVAVGATSGTPA